MLRTYTINLDHRTDRWAQACQNYAAHGLSPTAVQRFSAIADSSFGALGCAKSHVAVLAHFLTRAQEPYCMVLEDDFDFVRPFGDCVSAFNTLAQQRVEWDTLLLMGTAVFAAPPGPAGAARVVESQSAAAYLLSRRYAAQLLQCFVESLPQMEALRAPGLRPLAVSRLAIDVAWKALQRRDRWYIFAPAFGHQRASFSDIENKNVDYDQYTYGLAAA